MLEIDGVHKDLGGRRILDGVQLQGAPGEVIVLIGGNGSGKTTLLRIVAGILSPSRGSVRICGSDIERDPIRARTHLGYVPDTLDAFPELLVSELIELVTALKRSTRGAAPRHDPTWRERLGVAGIWGQRLRSLSFGQGKRVALLAALIGDPALLVLDEPSNGLDPSGVELIRALIDERRRAGQLTLLSTNDAELAALLAGKNHHLAGGRLTR
jgi:ABC-type multidrug transport system ATPase subunit